MTWQGHPRTSTAQWQATRKRILARDHGVCHVCHQPGANQVDHLVPWSISHDDSDTNLAAIHDVPCHRHKTSIEGNTARHRYTRLRPPEQHPGLR